MSLPADIVQSAQVLIEECDATIATQKSIVAQAILMGLDEAFVRRLRTVEVEMASTRGKAWKLKGECAAAVMTGQVAQPMPDTQQRVPTELELPLITDAPQRIPTGHPPRHMHVLSRKDLAAGEHDDR